MRFFENCTNMQKHEIPHYEVLRKLAPECMVLLKYAGDFPLKRAGKIAVYGNGVRHTIKGGTGSGDVNVRDYTRIEQGLEEAGFTITTKDWLNEYDEIRTNAYHDFCEEIKAKIRKEGPSESSIMYAVGAVMKEPEYEIPLEGEGNTAIYVVSRNSGEGADRSPEAGDFQLTPTEIRDIHLMCQNYEHSMLVLNVGGPLDISPILEEVPNILLLSQLGMVIGDSFADVLLGKSSPSGKLSSTWAKWNDYCKIGDFGTENDTRYREGIYVGYRYFDTCGVTPVFPFGYGLSYTRFAFEAAGLEVEQSKIELHTLVKNIGVYRGKETLQLYVSLPGNKLNQPYQVLAAFAKTKELEPGVSEEVILSFELESLAAFDANRSESILESGEYRLLLGNNSRNTECVGILCLEDEICVEKLSHVGGSSDFEDWIPETPVRYTKSAEKVPVCVLNHDNFKEKTKKACCVSEDVDDLVKSLSIEELIKVCVGGFKEVGSNSFIGAAGTHVAGSAGETTTCLEGKGILPVIMADGPAGLRICRQYGVDEKGIYAKDIGSIKRLLDMIPEEIVKALNWDKKEERHGEEFEQYCSAIPIGTAIAQSWNTELAGTCGTLVGKEMELYGIDIWLAPALNIHRNPLCGRNFEYYSEDPLLSGKMAAGITRGIQSHEGRIVALKHFVGNNQETNRMYSNSIMSERTLRDIYLKGFEIAVKESDPGSIMTSYNLLNGEHTSARKDLCETVLREEWGFTGFVMTDWVTAGTEQGKKYPRACAPGAIRAGNDIMMPGGKGDYDALLSSLDNPEAAYPISREDLERCAGRILNYAGKKKTL